MVKVFLSRYGAGNAVKCDSGKIRRIGYFISNY